MRLENVFADATGRPRSSSTFQMRFGLAIGFALLLAAEIPASAQIYPGGYPGGGYPGGGYPGGRYPGAGYPGGGYPGAGGGVGFPGGRRGRNQQQTENLTGMMRNLSSNNLELGTDDKRVISVSVNNKTKYYVTSGNTGRQSDFSPGDHVSIDALKDQNNYYYAVRVTLMEKGSPEDRAAASKPIEAGSPSSEASSQESNSGGSVAGDDDRPRLHRSPSSSSGDASGGPPAGNPSANSGASSTASASTQRPAPPDPDDSGPPVLRRGKPTGESSGTPSSGTRSAASGSTGAQSSSNSASARPTVTADEVNGVVRPPAPPQIARNSDGAIARTSLPQETSGDPVIQRAREAAFQFTETLPNYVVKQYTTRYQTDAASKDHTSWQALDTISADVVSEKGVETYKNLQVNGKPTKESPEKTGSWSTGEFSSMLQDILHSATNADFFNKRSSTVANRAAWHYDYTVEQPNSHWTVQASSETYKPAYKGSIWIDKETFRVLRIEMQARNLPTSFPLDTVESAVDYDYVLIGQGKFLLPVHSESLSCVRGSSDCSRNTIDFRNYRKFEADTSITFEPEKTSK